MSDSETNMNNALATLNSRIGEPQPPTDWFEITQERVNDYADVNMDHQWIHVDVEQFEGHKLSINYGFDRIRFPSPVKVGAKIRATRTLRRAEVKGGMIETMTEVVIEVQGQDKPALVAESLARLVF